MRILTRYILKEVLSYAALGGILFTFVLFMRDLGKVLELVVRDSASLADATRLILYTLPAALTLTIPMAVLVGILLGLSRLASDSEITAMRAAGMGALDFVRVLSLVSIGTLLLGLFNSLYLAPRAASGLLALEASLKNSQASFEVQPRIFYEDLKNYVLYIQDTRTLSGTAVWHHVFLADVSQPEHPSITTAEEAAVTTNPAGSGPNSTLVLHLMDGSQHQTSLRDPSVYNISTFASTEIPLPLENPDDTHISRNDTPIQALSFHELNARARQQSSKPGASSSNPYSIELNRRLSYPCACFVLMLVGVPLGLSSRRGGKSAGFVLTLVVVFLYYFLSSIGVALARNGKLSPFLGVWGSNLVFTLVGCLLLFQLSRGGLALTVVTRLTVWLQAHVTTISGSRDTETGGLAARITALVRRLRESFGVRFPLLLDDYVLREFSTNLLLVFGTFATMVLVFTFFELVGDIIRNRTPLVTVGDYLLNLIPYVIYNTMPLCALVAVLITFGSLSRTSELTAMKATGISLYRVVIPVLVLTGLLAVSLFAFDEFYLPAANRRQEALRAVIKGKPAQTFLRPDRKWISGTNTQPGEPQRIFFYKFFDADKNLFANLTVFEFQPDTFQLTRRIFAESAHWDAQSNEWVLERGWDRHFAGDVVSSFHPFATASFPEVREQPAYFKKEDRPSQEMSYHELSRYVSDLSQAGFDTMRLRVQLNRKLAYPLITFVMALLGIPFALATGKRGGLASIAVAVGLALSYWLVAGLFEAMGDVNTLPAALAAWSPDLLFGIGGAYLLMRSPT